MLEGTTAAGKVRNSLGTTIGPSMSFDETRKGVYLETLKDLCSETMKGMWSEMKAAKMLCRPLDEMEWCG